MDGIPPAVRRKAELAGAGGWLRALPDQVAGLAARWGLRIGEAYPDSTEAFVARARRADGAPAVLKVLVPRDGAAGDPAASEVTVLRLAAGDGCPRLLEADVWLGALLLERLGTPMHQLGLPPHRRHVELCAAASRIWRPAPGSGLTTGAQKGRWLIEHVTRTWETLDRPCSERAVDHATSCAVRRIAAHDDERAVLVHGDVHQWNALRAGTGFALVDPDGLLAEPEYDLGVILREDPVELLQGDPRDRARRLATLTGLDATAAWEWGVVERVSTGLLCTAIGLQPVGQQMLAAAEVIAQRYGSPP